MKPTQTREQILDAAQSAVLAKGFSGTSIDELIAAVGISKSGFFYHFRDKSDLAKALLERYIAEDDRIFDALEAQASSKICRRAIQAAWWLRSVTTSNYSHARCRR
jgi:AcrR family transcriptional regulator